MRSKVTLIIILFAIQLLGQDNYPRIEKFIVYDKIFKGYIDKYPITLYLKYKQTSRNHLGVYSVEGWYFYDKFETKIYLKGLYNFHTLTLYHFNDISKGQDLLSFKEIKNTYWEDIEYYENLSDFKEKFVFSDEGHSWFNGSNTLEVRVNQNDISILKVNEFLLLDSTIAFDLHNFGSWNWDFELLAHNSRKYILKYEYTSRLNIMGMCGGGVEKGFLIFEFDKNNILYDSEDFIYESCNRSIFNENQSEIMNGLSIYHCYDYSREKYYDLIVDLNEIKIDRKEIN
jgi:hypothetical protein